eukprot:4470022-Prymnesium_polylepis.2
MCIRDSLWGGSLWAARPLRADAARGLRVLLSLPQPRQSQPAMLGEAKLRTRARAPPTTRASVSAHPSWEAA